MTTIESNTTIASKLSQAEKDYWARTYSSCPGWCDSAAHGESGPYYDGSIRHYTAIGSIEAEGGHFQMTVSETIAAGEEYGDVVVQLEIDTVPGEVLKLHQIELGRFATEFDALIAKAESLVTSIQLANDEGAAGGMKLA